MARPGGVPLPPGARLQGIGRGEAYRGGRWRIPGPPAERLPPGDGTAGLLLPPEPPQRLQGGECTDTGRPLGAGAPRQALRALRANLPGTRLARAGLVRQAGVVGAAAVARVPGGTCWRTQAGATPRR
jgi:hypothetical protein